MFKVSGWIRLGRGKWEGGRGFLAAKDAKITKGMMNQNT